MDSGLNLQVSYGMSKCFPHMHLPAVADLVVIPLALKITLPLKLLSALNAETECVTDRLCETFKDTFSINTQIKI